MKDFAKRVKVHTVKENVFKSKITGDTHSRMTHAQGLLSDDQGIMEKVACFFEFTLVSGISGTSCHKHFSENLRLGLKYSNFSFRMCGLH